MLHLLSRYRHISLFVLFVLVSLALLSSERPANNTLPQSSNALKRGMLLILQPFQQAVTAVIGYGQHVWSGYIDMVDLAQENQRLNKEIQRLRAEKNRYIENSLAYERLEGTLELLKDRQFSTILARVIAPDPTNQSNIIIVNRGADHGIQESWPVITQDGVVGVTLNVSTKSSKVLLLSDPNCNVAALIQRTRDQGIVGGQAKKDAYVMKYVNRRGTIREGAVYTLTQASLGEIAKEGIPGYMLTDQTLLHLQENYLPADVVTVLEVLKDRRYSNQQAFLKALEATIGKEQADFYQGILVQNAQAGLLVKLRELIDTQHASREEFLEALVALIGQENTEQYASRILRHVREDEVVVSSGLGGIFPKGLMIGTVSKVVKQDYGLFQAIEVAPSVDFSKLEEVLIIRREDTIAAQ